MKVGEILFKQGFIEEGSIVNALTIQHANNKNIGEILIDIGAIQKNTLHEALSFQKTLEMDRYANKVNFLENNMPFNLLTRADLEEIAESMEWESFLPKNIIFSQDKGSDKFIVVKNGLVKACMGENGTEVIVGFLGEGECFGEMPMLSDSPRTPKYEAIEDVLCLSQRREAFLRMVQKHSIFYNFFHQLLNYRMSTVYKEFLVTNTSTVNVEPALYKKQVKDLLPSAQIFCSHKATTKEAARELMDNGLETIIVTDESAATKGILGYRDIVKAVLLEGKDPLQPIETIMEKQYKTIDAESFLYDAIHEMVKHKTNQLIVLDKGKTVGLLTTFDILKHKGIEVLSLLKNIDEAPSISELNAVRSGVENVLSVLMADGALASHVCKIISEFNDKIVKRAIALVEKDLGYPPSSYAWLGLGSEGRKEQTLLTDQDNAIIYLNSPSGDTEEYFKTFSHQVTDALNRCGFPLCKGNVMATNPKYSGSITQWKKRTAEWILSRSLSENEIIDIFVFFDFRTIYGNKFLEFELKSHMMKLIKENRLFLKLLAQVITSIPMPLGFFKNFIVEKNGKYKNTLNIKNYGLLLLTTCVKMLAFQQGIFETNTLERIKKLNKDKIIKTDLAEFLEQSFETFLTLKIRNDLNDRDRGRDFSNRIDPATLTARQKQLLKEAFLAVSQLQKITQEVLKIENQNFYN